LFGLVTAVAIADNELDIEGRGIVDLTGATRRSEWSQSLEAVVMFK
jgi:hypothetical protein